MTVPSLDRPSEKHLEKWAYALLLVGTLLRISFFYVATNNGGDAMARATTTAKWLEHPSLSLDFVGPHWLPIHFWMMAFLAVLVRNVELGCRLLSLLFGVLSLWLFWRLARDVYGIRAALLSLTLFVFYTLHIAYSTTSSSEATYLGLLLAGLLSFVLYRRTGSLGMLALAGISLTLDAGVRYEAWIFIALTAVLLLFTTAGEEFWSWAHFRGLMVFTITAGVWPIFWMIHQWRVHHNAFFAITHNTETIPASLAVNPAQAGLYQLLLTPGVILLTLTPLAVIGAAYALWLAIQESKARELAIIAVGFAVIQFRSLVTGGLLAGARYTLTDGLFVALIAGYGLWRLWAKFTIVSYSAVLSATALVLVCNLALVTSLSAREGRYADKFRSISPLLQYQVQVDHVGKFLLPRLAPTDRVVIDTYNDDSNIVAAAIGFPLVPHDRAFLASQTDPALVSQYIDAYQPRYVILSQDGVLRNYLRVPHNCPKSVRLNGLDYTCAFSDQIYQVYSVSYPVLTANTSRNFSDVHSTR
jgi:4-amino-4-deoxy-L-arabinose transferase-like glycosyltransferase